MKKVLKIVMPFIGRAGIGTYLFLGLISGLSSFLFINLVTKVIALLTAGTYTAISKEYITTFIAVIFLFTWSRKVLAVFSIKTSQKVVWNLRKKILKLTLNANYQALATKKSLIQASILSDVGALASASIGSIDFFIQIVMAIACLIYLASISSILFFITLLISMVGISIYMFSAKSNMKSFQNTRKIENKFQENMNAILNGFKEIFMEPNKGKYIYEQKICQDANESYYHQVNAITGLVNNQIIGQVLSYLLITSVILIFSVTLNIKASNIIGFILTLLYLLGSISSIMVLFPSVMMAGVAADNLLNLQQDLESMESESNRVQEEKFLEAFERIRTNDLKFKYSQDISEFAIGPINFTIDKNETKFIFGANGSGKTTFVYALLGLCIPNSGCIYVNEMPVNQSNYKSYRSLFSVVFNDFYLFEGVIGVEEINFEKWNRYLVLFELKGKVFLNDHYFSSTDLSTGQRKRLALIAALLEEKPILILDEWAADQDPYFRRKFYTKIIPVLNNDGYTIVAITHDDKYYYCAHKVYKMENGDLLEEQLNVQHNFVQEAVDISPLRS